jgi:hypothetical protein
MKNRGLLLNRAVFLSASVPSRAEWRESTSRQAGALIRSAVIACTQRVLFEGGTLVFGGHPSVSPFILSVADDYLPAPSEQGSAAPRIWIYQSRAFPPAVRPDSTTRLLDRGARLVETDAAPGETFKPGLKHEQCLRSLDNMRDAMLTHTDPISMIVIGGMEGVLRECASFRDKYPHRPIWTFESTGGMAAQLRAPRMESAARIYRTLNSSPEKINAIAVEASLWSSFDAKQASAPPFILLAERLVKATLDARTTL